MDLHEVFREGWLWANEQMSKFRWQSTNRLLPVSILPLPTVEINVTSLASGCTLYCCNHTYNGLTFIVRQTSDTWLPLWWVMNFCSWVVPFVMPIKEALNEHSFYSLQLLTFPSLIQLHRVAVKNCNCFFFVRCRWCLPQMSERWLSFQHKEWLMSEMQWQTFWPNMARKRSVRYLLVCDVS